MALSWTDAQTAVLAPGSGTPFELTEAEIRGVKMDVFKNCPPNLALVLQNARNFGDNTFILYEGEKWTFAKTMDQVDGLSHVLVNKYGVKKATELLLLCVTSLSGSWRLRPLSLLVLSTCRSTHGGPKTRWTSHSLTQAQKS